jgi:hypothetical protein
MDRKYTTTRNPDGTIRIVWQESKNAKTEYEAWLQLVEQINLREQQ